MENQQNADVASQQEAVKANWAAINEDYSEVIVQEGPEKKEESAENIQDIDNEGANENQDADLNQEQENKEGENNEDKEKTDENQDNFKEGDEKTEDAENKEDDLNLELKVDDIQDVPLEFEDGTFQGLANDLGFKIENESYEEFEKTFKENFVPRSELEKANSITFDSVLATLKPETAAALKLLEMGIPEQTILAPTSEIDYYLSLDDAAIVRADLQKTEGWTEELIDAKMEELAEDPKKLGLYAGEIRIGLNAYKKDIIDTRNAKLQEYESLKSQRAAQLIEQERSQFIETLNNVSEFMGVPLSKDVKNAILAKYNKGLYENEINKANSQVNAILYKEYGDKIAKHLQNKASEKAKVETRKKLINTPPLTTKAGSKVEIKNQDDNNWSAMKEDFGS